jgi:hypothetical protein
MLLSNKNILFGNMVIKLGCNLLDPIKISKLFQFGVELHKILNVWYSNSITNHSRKFANALHKALKIFNC